MPRVTHLQTAFAAGEISPRLYGRVDVAKYQNGAKKMRDALPQVYGGARRRPGSLFVQAAKFADKAARLIPFVRSNSVAYMLEFGEGYIRVFKDGVQVHELTNPYTAAQLFDVDYAQGADTMFLFHEAVYPYTLVCAGDTSWTIGAASFLNLPFEVPGSYPSASLTPGATGPVGTVSPCTASAAVFDASNVGSYLKVNGGIIKITAFISATEVTGTVTQELEGLTAAPALAWSLHAPAWSAAYGYPRTGTLFEQRLVMGGSPKFPQTIWGSITGGYLDFQMGDADDAAYSFTVASDAVNPIRFLASGRVLLALTTGGEFTITGGTEKPLAPTNAQIKARTNYGCARVRPVRYRDSEIFVQRAGRKVRKFSYNVATDDWSGPDLSVLAEHLTEGYVADMTWQQEPDSTVWIARQDGALLSITLDADQDVTAWAWHEGFAGLVESVAAIPTSTGDEVWLVVRRTINGASVRYLERLSADTTLDCSVVASGSASTVWGGLDHLEGQSVGVVADGSYAGAFTVEGGQITLARAASEVNMGLVYAPKLTLLDPEIQTGMGSASGNAMRTSEVTVRFFETTGCNVNGKAMNFRRTGSDALDQAPVPFSGVKRLENLGWERGQDELEFTQPDPMPFHILSVTRKFTVNDG